MIGFQSLIILLLFILNVLRFSKTHHLYLQTIYQLIKVFKFCFDLFCYCLLQALNWPDHLVKLGVGLNSYFFLLKHENSFFVMMQNIHDHFEFLFFYSMILILIVLSYIFIFNFFQIFLSHRLD